MRARTRDGAVSDMNGGAPRGNTLSYLTFAVPTMFVFARLDLRRAVDGQLSLITRTRTPLLKNDEPNRAVFDRQPIFR